MNLLIAAVVAFIVGICFLILSFIYLLSLLSERRAVRRRARFADTILAVRVFCFALASLNTSGSAAAFYQNHTATATALALIAFIAAGLAAHPQFARHLATKMV